MRHVLVRGERRTGYHDVGDGAALILLHAFPLNADMWRPQIDAAPQGWRLIVPDLRGFGTSSGDAPAASMDDYARDVLSLLDDLGITRAVVGGLSMGGYVAFALRRLALRRVTGLVLADTRPQADTDEAREARRQLQQVALTQGSSAVADRMVGRLLGRTSQASHPALVARVRDLIVANDAAAVVAALGSMSARPDATGDLAAITVPTLILVGAEDEMTPPALSAGMHDAIAGSTLVEIPGAGHLSNLEAPTAFNAALFGFLGRLTSL